MSSDQSSAEDDFSEDSEIDDQDADGYRVSQWDDDEQMEDIVQHSRPVHSSSTTFGALAVSSKKASGVGENSISDDDDVSESSNVMLRKTKSGGISEKRPRANKHAPTEVSTKFQVPRRKATVESNKPRPRDPRFSSSGEFSSDAYKKNYQFLSEMRQKELSVLKDNLKRARKLLVSSPRDQREEREAEVERLERTLKRAESSVNRDRREEIERGAIEKVVKEEKAKQKMGKKTWYLKHSAEKEIKLRARYEGIKASGGTKAVKKALEKRQKKLRQADKRQRL